MKIRIADQIFDIDEQTLLDWVRLGRVPPDAFVFSETLTDGKWQSVRELDRLRSLWSVDGDSAETSAAKAAQIEKELKTEREFLAYQKRRPAVTMTLIAINTIVFLLMIQTGVGVTGWIGQFLRDLLVGQSLRDLLMGSQDQRVLIQFGAYSYRLIVEAGEYWRLITHTFLHANTLHLVLNMGVVLIVGRLIEGLYGSWRFLILYLISAIGGSIASLPFVQEASGVGASGAVFGLMGAVVALGLRYKEQLPRRRGRIFGLRLLPFIGIDIVLGFLIPSINNAAHLGGLATGFVSGMILVPEIYSDRTHQTRMVPGVAAILSALFIISGGITVWHYFDPEERVNTRMETAFPPPSREDLPSHVERYEKAIRKRGYDPRAYALLEALYIEAFRNYPDDPLWEQKLKQFYEEVLDADPGNPIWNNNLIAFYQETAQGGPEEKEALEAYIKLCEKVERKRGYHRQLYHSLQHFYMRAKVTSPQEGAFWDRKLENLYKEAVKKDPAYGTWSNNLAWFYVEQQTQSKRAVKLALNAVKQEPTETNFLDTLGWAYLRNGQHRKALRAFEQVFSFPAKTEEKLRAQESSWQGVDELVHAEIPSQEAQEFSRAFLKFYGRMSDVFADDSASLAKLDAAFDVFQQSHRDG